MGDEDKTVSQADYDKAVERAQKFEAQLADVQKQLDKWKGFDPSDIKAKLADYERIREEEAKGDPKKLEALVEERVKDFKSKTADQIKELTKERDDYKGKLREHDIVNVALTKASGKYVPHAEEELRERIRRFGDRDDNGNVIYRDDKGEVRMSKANRALPMTTEEFLEETFEAKPHWKSVNFNGGGHQKGERFNGTDRTYTWAELQSMGAEGKEILKKLPVEQVKELSKQIF